MPHPLNHLQPSRETIPLISLSLSPVERPPHTKQKIVQYMFIHLLLKATSCKKWPFTYEW